MNFTLHMLHHRYCVLFIYEYNKGNYIYIYIYIYIYFIKQCKHLLSTHFCIYPIASRRIEFMVGDCISENNNTYIGLTSANLSIRLAIHLPDTSSIAQHLKKTFQPKNRVLEISHRKHNNIRTNNKKNYRFSKRSISEFNRINFESRTNALKCP